MSTAKFLWQSHPVKSICSNSITVALVINITVLICTLQILLLLVNSCIKLYCLNKAVHGRLILNHFLVAHPVDGNEKELAQLN